MARDVDATGWVVDLLRLDRESFSGTTLEAALARCLEWLMAVELSGGTVD